MILIGISLILLPVGLSLYDVYSQKRHNSSGSTRIKYDSLFHLVKFWLLVLGTGLFLYWISIVVQFQYNLNLWLYIKYIPLSMVVYMILFDGYWGVKHGVGFFYPGDGKGGFIEMFVFWLSKRIKFLDFILTMILFKVFLLFGSVFLIIK